MGEQASIRRESPVALLEMKLVAWMKQQPEWLHIVSLPRQQRRAAMRELANRLYTIPLADTSDSLPRAAKRSRAYKGFVRVAEQTQAKASELSALAQASLEEAKASVALDREGEAQTVAVSRLPELPDQADAESDGLAEEAPAVERDDAERTEPAAVDEA